MMRRVALIALKFTLLLMLAAVVAACGGAAEPGVSMVADTPTPASVASTPTALPEEKPVIGLVMKTLTNPFFVEMERGARRAEQELGVELIVRTGAQETSVEQQIAIVRDMIAQGVDAIVICLLYTSDAADE